MDKKKEGHLDREEDKKIPVFTVVKNGAILKNIFLREFEETLVVGRHPDCNITLEHPSISRFHLRIHYNPSYHSLSVIDLSSVHGTWISGKKIESGVRVELEEGDRMQLGGSSRVYRLHWVPISRAYDMENPFVPPYGDTESAEATLEEQHQDECGFSIREDQIQKEDDDMVQGLDSSFSNMSLLPCGKSLTPPAPSTLEQMSSPFPEKFKPVNENLPENIHEDGGTSFLQPAYQPDEENSAPQALLVSGLSRTENADGTPARLQQRCSSIWSRSGKQSRVQIQTGTDTTMNGKADTDTEVESLNHERAEAESVSQVVFASGNNDVEEEVFTASKENDTPSSLFLGSMKKSCLSEMTNGLGVKSSLSKMDESDEDIFTPDKENMTPNTCLLRSMKNMESQHQIKHPKPFKCSYMKNVVKPIFNQAERLESNKKEKLGPDDNDKEILTPDKENMTPRLMRSMKKIGKLEEVQHLEAFKFPLNSVVDCIFDRNETPITLEKDTFDKVLEEQKSAILASRNLARAEVNIVKNRKNRVPFQYCFRKTSTISPQKCIKLSGNLIKYLETKETYPFANNSAMEQQRWTMVVDTGSLLNKESRKSLQLLQGLNGTHLIIPRTVIRELDCMKRGASLFRRITEVSAALEWIEDCMVNAKSWVHVQSCAEETTAAAPTTPATTPLSLFSEGNGMIHRSHLYSTHSGLMEFASPTADHILEYALFFQRSNRNGQLVLLSNDLTMKIKAMAEGLNCETAEEFRESLVNPFSERFLWKDSSPRGRTWSSVDDFVPRKTYYHGPQKKPLKSADVAKGLKLLLLHNSHYRPMCSAN